MSFSSPGMKQWLLQQCNPGVVPSPQTTSVHPVQRHGHTAYRQLTDAREQHYMTYMDTDMGTATDIGMDMDTAMDIDKDVDMDMDADTDMHKKGHSFSSV